MREIEFVTEHRAVINNVGPRLEKIENGESKWIDTESREGWFHKFSQEINEDGLGYTVAIVEDKYGLIQTVETNQIRFLHSPFGCSIIEEDLLKELSVLISSAKQRGFVTDVFFPCAENLIAHLKEQ